MATTSVPRTSRLDFWQNLFNTCDVALPDRPPRPDFQAELLSSPSHDGTIFMGIKGDPLVCRFGRHDSGLVLLGRIREGALHVEHGDQRTVLDRSSGLVLVDCDRRLTTTATPYELAELVIPRALLTALPGGDPLQRNAVVRLPSGGLAPILLAHLEAMAIAGAGLDAAEATVAMEAATALALTLLARGAIREEGGAPEEGSLFTAARRVIQAEAGRHDLTARMIAAALGCSRAHLYRVFAAREQSVAGMVRDVRLARARQRLADSPARPIGDIAFDCGYSDASAFGKAFRRRYGLSPGEWRHEAREARRR